MNYSSPTNEEKVAMIRICLDLAQCDGGLNAGKIEGLNRVVSCLQCGQSDVDKAQKMNSANAILVAQKMTEANRDVLIWLLYNVARSDGPTTSREEECINITKMLLNL